MIHRTAIVEDGVTLGSEVEVGPYAYVEAGAVIGDQSRIGPHAVVYGRVCLGQRCTVHAGAVLGDTPQDMGFDGGESAVRVGDDCVIREGVTIHRGTKPGTETVVGNECFLMAFSHLAHNVRLGNQVIVANGAVMGGYAEVGDRAFISGNTSVHEFVKVGRLAMMGGGGGMSKDLPPFCTTRPVTLNGVAGLNVVGMRRAGMSSSERADVKQAFNILYRSGLNTTQARAQLAETFSSGPGQEFVEFIDASTRGVCPLS